MDTAQLPASPVIGIPTPHPYQQVINVLASAFDHFNTTLLNNELLDSPIIAVLPRGRRAAYGWFADEKWNDKGTMRPEISISAETLDRPIAEVLGTLAHEMAHMLNAQNGIKDCNAAQYHNKHFKTAAERLGLTVTKIPGKGFARTTVNNTAQAAIDTFCQMENVSVFKDFRRVESSTGKPYIQVHTVPVHLGDKQFIQTEAQKRGLKIKDFISDMIAVYQEK